MEMNKKKGRRSGAIIFGSPTYHALKIVAGCAVTGIALAVFVAAPGLSLAAKPLIEYLRDRDKREWRREQQRLKEAIGRLQRRRLVKLINRGGETYIFITKEGKSFLRKFDIQNISIAKPEKWDGKWRIVLFDIPEKHRRGRNALREKLSSLGFYPLQKSALLFPYECQDEVDFIVNFFVLSRYVQYVVCDDLGFNEAKIRKHFGLLV